MAPPHPPNPYSGLPKDTTLEEAELYAEGGPYWWRGLAENQDERIVCRWATDLKEKLGVKRIIGVGIYLNIAFETDFVKGHTPNFERIVDRCNVSIIIIDTGEWLGHAACVGVINGG